MSLQIDESKIPGRHRLSYRINDGARRFPVRDVDVLATQKEVEHLVREGYLVRPRMIPDHELGRLRAAFDEVFAADKTTERGSGTFTGTFARHLADKHAAFLDLIACPPFLSVARAVLGPSVQSRGITGRFCPAGEPNQEVEWHFHQRVIPDPLPPFFTRPHTLDVLIYLDDARGKNGPLCVLPRSHQQLHLDCPTGNVRDMPGQVVIEAEPGTCVFAHGALWHRTLPMGPDCDTRRLVISGYGACWVKPAIYGVKPENGLTEQAAEGADEELLELLGLRGYM